MATNAFIEFSLDEAQKLADYTSIQSDLRSAREFAAAIVKENQKPQPNYSLMTRSWSQLLFDTSERFRGVSA